MEQDALLYAPWGQATGQWWMQPAAGALEDPRAAIAAAAEAGRHEEAASLAATWEQHARRASGPDSAEVIDWVLIRADLARLAARWPTALQLWLTVARHRIAHEEAEAARLAVQNLLHCWQFVSDAQSAEVAEHILTLVRQAPELDSRLVAAAEARIADQSSPAHAGLGGS